MTQTINLRTNVKEVTKGLSRLHRRQIPFATSRALNRTGNLAFKGLRQKARRTFDGGAAPGTITAFTPRNRGPNRNIIYSTKEDLRTVLFLPDWAAKYLQYQIEGGVRRTKGAGTGVPTRNKSLNEFGNIKGRKAGLVKGKKQFVATKQGIHGVWEKYGRKGSSVRLLIAFEKNPRYTKKFKYYETITTMARVHLDLQLKKSLKDAIRDAR